MSEGPFDFKITKSTVFENGYFTTNKRWKDNIKEWIGMEFASSGLGLGVKWIVVKSSSVVSQPSRYVIG